MRKSEREEVCERERKCERGRKRLKKKIVGARDLLNSAISTFYLKSSRTALTYAGTFSSNLSLSLKLPNCSLCTFHIYCTSNLFLHFGSAIVVYSTAGLCWFIVHSKQCFLNDSTASLLDCRDKKGRNRSEPRTPGSPSQPYSLERN